MSDHNFLTPRDESLADDLNKERGIVRGRVALLPRSAEIQPLFRRFVGAACARALPAPTTRLRSHAAPPPLAFPSAHLLESARCTLAHRGRAECERPLRYGVERCFMRLHLPAPPSASPLPATPLPASPRLSSASPTPLLPRLYASPPLRLSFTPPLRRLSASPPPRLPAAPHPRVSLLPLHLLAIPHLRLATLRFSSPRPLPRSLPRRLLTNPPPPHRQFASTAAMSSPLDAPPERTIAATAVAKQGVPLQQDAHATAAASIFSAGYVFPPSLCLLLTVRLTLLWRERSHHRAYKL